MLQKQVVEQQTLDLLIKIQSIREFSELRLVGGTALALQYGHRRSIDLDFFGNINFENISFENILNSFASVRMVNNSPFIKQYFIDNVKVGFVEYPYSWLSDEVIKNGIRLASPEDIAAMKMAAVTNRGSKKDFVDIYYLLKDYSLSELLGFYESKYHDGSVFLVLKSLIYFEDAQDEEMPYVFDDLSWQEIKESIIHSHNNHMEQF
jgi:predicted nucleotidyltransferase component of viral defense system